MVYFKDINNIVYELSRPEDKDCYEADSLTEITESEALEILAPPPETTEQIIKRLESALDAHLDAVANSYRYESIRTMVTYATSEHSTFGPEGRAAVKFRDAVYAKGIEKIAVCTREVDPEPIPTEAELIADMPDFADFL